MNLDRPERVNTILENLEILVAWGAEGDGDRDRRQAEAYIVGGEESAPYSRPYMVLIQRFMAYHGEAEPEWKDVCGGAIISHKYVFFYHLSFWHFQYNQNSAIE